MGRRGRREKRGTPGASGRGGKDWFIDPSTPKHGGPKFQAPTEAQELARKKHGLQAQWKAVQDQIATNYAMHLPVSDFLEKREQTLREQLNQIERQESHARASAPAQKKTPTHPTAEPEGAKHRASLETEKLRILAEMRRFGGPVFEGNRSVQERLRAFKNRLAEVERELGVEPDKRAILDEHFARHDRETSGISRGAIERDLHIKPGAVAESRRSFLRSERARISRELDRAYEELSEYPDSVGARKRYRDWKERFDKITEELDFGQ